MPKAGCEFSFKLIAQLLFRLFPINKLFLARLHALLRGGQFLFVPRWRFKSFFVPAQVVPDGFQGHEFFRLRHLLEGERNHGTNLLADRPTANHFSATFSLGTNCSSHRFASRNPFCSSFCPALRVSGASVMSTGGAAS